MSMTTLKILQFVGMFAAYSAVTVWLPSVMFRSLLQNRRLSERFMMCYTFGNFYIINLVFVVQLLHISNRFTLILVTLLPSMFIWKRVNHVPLKEKALRLGKIGKKMIQGKLGIHTVTHQILFEMGRKGKAFAKVFDLVVVRNPVEWLALAAVIAAVLWVYGRQIMLVYGYCASDVPVHMSWINQMSRGNLFSSGVYPFGFHCMVYYLHEVFGFDVYVLMCEFFCVEVFYAHLVLLVGLKLLCKSTYFPYIGVLIYVLGGFWSDGSYLRYYSSLPQEFGMIFIVPSIYFLIHFFQIPKAELRKKETYYQLACFAMAFALTLIIHFYGTMIAGLCCVGIGLGYFFRFFRKEYFCRIMATGIISVVVAVLPMGIAFATGTPLEGSLRWGMSILESSEDKTEQTVTVEESSESDEESLDEQDEESLGELDEDSSGELDEDSSGELDEDSSGENSMTENPEQSGSLAGDEQQTSNEVVKRPVFERVKERTLSLLMRMSYNITQFVIYNRQTPFGIEVGYWVMGAVAVLFPLGLLFLLYRRIDYAGLLFSVGAYMGILTMLLSAKALGLPTLMDASRCGIYYAYLLISVLTLFCDACVYFASLRIVFIRNFTSLVVSILIGVTLIRSGWLKGQGGGSAFVTNGAVVCWDNIIYENEDWNWTIVSANDETQVVLDHGWHYETIDFLREMEYLEPDTELTLPTEVIYIFIEKIPVSYLESYSESGQSVSIRGAMRSLPGGSGISMYKGENRWIVMSRMYYWAQAFSKMYPNELQVYYETGDFVCYKIEQNTYHLYNFAIDYGYNTVVMETAEEEQE